MDLLFWHGYLLTDTGSNVFTREMVRAVAAGGHSVILSSQDACASEYVGSDVRVIRPELGGFLPVFVVDRYPDIEARHVADFADDELARYVDANVSAILEAVEGSHVDALVANHAIMGGPVAAAAAARTGLPYTVYVHGSELEYAIRGRPALARMATAALAGANVIFAGSRHTAEVTCSLLGASLKPLIELLPPGVDVDRFTPERGPIEALTDLLREPSDPAAPGAERRPDRDAAAKLAGIDRFVLFFGKLIPQKGVELLIDAWRAIEPSYPGVHLVIVGFGDDRARLEQRAAGSRVVFTGALGHEHLQLLIPFAETVVVPSVMAEAFGMVAAEAAACGVIPIVAAHSGLAEVAEGLGEGSLTFDGTPGDLERTLREVLDLPDAERRRRGGVARERAVRLWSWSSVARRMVEVIATRS